MFPLKKMFASLFQSLIAKHSIIIQLWHTTRVPKVNGFQHATNSLRIQLFAYVERIFSKYDRGLKKIYTKSINSVFIKKLVNFSILVHVVFHRHISTNIHDYKYFYSKSQLLLWCRLHIQLQIGVKNATVPALHFNAYSIDNHLKNYII